MSKAYWFHMYFLTSWCTAYLISAAYLHLILHTKHACKLHEAQVIKVVLDAKAVAVSGKVVPLVHINCITFVCHNLTKN